MTRIAVACELKLDCSLIQYDVNELVRPEATRNVDRNQVDRNMKMTERGRMPRF